MRYELRVTAFDVMDRVHVATALYRTGQGTEPPTVLVGTRVTTVPGTGESDPWQWATDALVAAVENL